MNKVQQPISEAIAEVQAREGATRSERLRRVMDTVDRLTSKGLIQEERFNLVSAGSANVQNIRCSARPVRKQPVQVSEP